MKWENNVDEILVEVQETEKLVSAGPGDQEATITSNCGGFLSLACC